MRNILHTACIKVVSVEYVSFVLAKTHLYQDKICGTKEEGTMQMVLPESIFMVGLTGRHYTAKDTWIL